MKKVFALLLVLACALAISGATDASDPPRRSAVKVDDVFEPYTVDEDEGWIVSTDEESTGDQDTDDVAETDIREVIACYDDDYLRVDILLNNSISFDWATLYAIKFEYNDMNEYYTYYTDTKKLEYKKEKGGKIVKTKILVANDTNDYAGVSDSGDKKDADVYFIINKADHIGGEKGKRYYLTCYFYSGYLTKSDKIHIADKTIPVDLEFEF